MVFYSEQQFLSLWDYKFNLLTSQYSSSPFKVFLSMILIIVQNFLQCFILKKVQHCAMLQNQVWFNFLSPMLVSNTGKEKACCFHQN